MIIEKERIKEMIREGLRKRIVLFGAGKVAVDFYNAYKDTLNISRCVSNFRSEWGEKSFLGELDVVEYRKEDIDKDEYIIVCGPRAFKYIELQLQDDGFSVYSDFIESGMASVMCSNKKIALFYGSCILRDVYLLLQDYKPFTDKFVSSFTQFGKHEAVVSNRVLMYMKEICDLYVYSQKMLDRDTIFYLGRDELPDDCQCISISNLTLPLYWPQCASNPDEHNPYHIHSHAIRRDLQFYHTVFQNEDYGISKLVLEGRSNEDIIAALSSDDYYSENQVNRNRLYNTKLIQMAEKGTDISILDYVEENYKTELLYQNPKHPSKPVLCYYVYRLLEETGIPLDEFEEFKRNAPLKVHESGDVPIYPSVVKYLQLEFIDDSTRYTILTEDGIYSMSFSEYVSYMADYTRKSIELMKLW